MKYFSTVLIVLALTSCFRKADSISVQKNVASSFETSDSIQKNMTSLLRASDSLPKLNKKQREAIYFAASLEKEALKVLIKDSAFDKPTLFSVLSYAIEADSGIKSKAPSPLDCTRFRIDTQPKNEKIFRVLKVCQRPEMVVAEIQIGLGSEDMTIHFFVKEWISVLGYSTTLSGDEIKCDLKVLNKKLNYLDCQGWNRMLSSTANSAEELRLKTFLFDRQGVHQFTLKGGIYKDLVEHKKIEVYVPVEGKIKRIEHEIEVIDEYLETPPVPETRPARVQIKPNPQDKNPEPEGDFNEKENQQKSKSENQQENRESDQDGNQKSRQKSRQKTTEESHPESRQKNIEDQRETNREERPIESKPSNSGNQSINSGSDQIIDPGNGSLAPSPGR